MPIDTAQKRRKAIDFGKIRGTGMPIPSGIILAVNRPHILNLYFEYVAPPATIYWRNKNRVSGTWKSKLKPSTSWKSRGSIGGSWKNKNTPDDGNTQVI